MRGTSFDFFRLQPTRPECEKESVYPLRHAVVDDNVACRFCGALIDLTGPETRARLQEEAETCKRLWKLVK